MNRSLLGAAAWGNVKAVRHGLAAGADLEERNALGETCIICAAKNPQQQTDMIRDLIDAGANVNAVATNGRTALLEAIERRHVSVVRLLLERGADVTTEQQRGALSHACDKATGHLEIMRLLMSAGASVLEGNPEPLAALCFSTACYKTSEAEESKQSEEVRTRGSYPERVRLLIHAGARMHARDARGQSALHKACLFGQYDSVTELLLAGADGLATDGSGATPLSLALQPTTAFHGDHEGKKAIAALLQHGESRWLQQCWAPQRHADYPPEARQVVRKYARLGCLLARRFLPGCQQHALNDVWLQHVIPRVVLF